MEAVHMKLSVSVGNRFVWRGGWSLPGIRSGLHLYILGMPGPDVEWLEVAAEDAVSGKRATAKLQGSVAAREAGLREFLVAFLPQVTELEVARVLHYFDRNMRLEEERRRR